MTEKEFKNYLENRYEDQLGWYSKKSKRYKRCYQWIQGAIFLLSAFLSFIVIIAPEHLGIVAFMSSTLVFLTAILKAFKFQEDWINYRTTAEILKREKQYYDAKIGEYGTAKNAEQLFVERIEVLMSKENTSWTDVRLQKETEKSQEDS